MQKPVELQFKPAGKEYVLQVKTSKNEPGLIYRITGVLFVYDLNILGATASTDEEGNVDDIFKVMPQKESSLNEQVLNQIEGDLEKVLLKKMSMFDYLAIYPDKLETLKNFRADEETSIEVESLPAEKAALVTIETTDRPGLLFDISQVLFLYSLDIVSVEAEFNRGKITDRIKIRAENESLLDESGLARMRQTMLKEI